MYREYLKFQLIQGKVTIWLGELSQVDPSGQHLQYRIQVWHDDTMVKEMEISKFHLALFTFHKSIDAEVLNDVQNKD